MLGWLLWPPRVFDSELHFLLLLWHRHYARKLLKGTYKMWQIQLLVWCVSPLSLSNSPLTITVALSVPGHSYRQRKVAKTAIATKSSRSGGVFLVLCSLQAVAWSAYYSTTTVVRPVRRPISFVCRWSPARCDLASRLTARRQRMSIPAQAPQTHWRRHASRSCCSWRWHAGACIACGRARRSDDYEGHSVGRWLH